MDHGTTQERWERRAGWIAAAGLMFLILYFSYETRDDSLQRTDGLLRALLPVLERFLGPFVEGDLTLAMLRGPIRKLAHVVNFFLLGIAVSLAFLRGGHGTRRDLWKAFVVVVAFAGLDEMLQLLRPLRGAQVQDVLIDSVGAGLAWLLVWVATRRGPRDDTKEFS